MIAGDAVTYTDEFGRRYLAFVEDYESPLRMKIRLAKTGAVLVVSEERVATIDVDEQKGL